MFPGLAIRLRKNENIYTAIVEHGTKLTCTMQNLLSCRWEFEEDTIGLFVDVLITRHFRRHDVLLLTGLWLQNSCPTLPQIQQGNEKAQNVPLSHIHVCRDAPPGKDPRISHYDYSSPHILSEKYNVVISQNAGLFLKWIHKSSCFHAETFYSHAGVLINELYVPHSE